MWVLTPTVSETRLSSFGTMQKEGWLSGVYFLADALRTAIVAIHQLPQIPETLWLRLLGRGNLQSQAIIELQTIKSSIPKSNPGISLQLARKLESKSRIRSR
ncbi:hypothetical protein NIES4072_51520 [Nostoc commune NIES-4072]|uniref:Uncharacterized protein n=1 Tax=Nostoc commune NIES-4072 TaxID=2005467 RepID=A0A2R5FRS9_NOSCO|nr:hypothetical protein NIES4070_39430 [Nostoc commune HK-02]GBG21467.1 hypothetical protein NIES4072_51520 [Nostoc commune NIES-4072]